MKTGVRTMKHALAAVPLLERDGRRASVEIAAEAQLNNAREERGVGRRRGAVVLPAVRLEHTTGALLNVAEVAICDERRPQKLLDGLAFMWYDLDGGRQLARPPGRPLPAPSPRTRAPRLSDRSSPRAAQNSNVSLEVSR